MPVATAAVGAFVVLTLESAITVFVLELWMPYIGKDGSFLLSLVANGVVAPLVSFAVWFKIVREVLNLDVGRFARAALVGAALATPLAVVSLAFRVAVGWDTDETGALLVLPGSTIVHLTAFAAPSVLLVAVAYARRMRRHATRDEQRDMPAAVNTDAHRQIP